MTVVPGGVVARRHYGAAAIAFACLLLGVSRLGVADVRRRVAPGITHEQGWAVVRRWLSAVHAGLMFPFVRPWSVGLDLHGRAERVAVTVMAFAPGTFANNEERLFAGIALAA